MNTPNQTPPRKALVYATFDGIITAHSGIGTQTTAFLHESAVNRQVLIDHHIESIYIAYPTTRQAATGYEYDPHAWSRAQPLVDASAAHLWSLDWDADVYWSPPAWHQMCASLAARITSLLTQFDEIIVLAIDAVFLRLSAHLSAEARLHVQLVHVWYSSVLISGMADNPDRLAAERWCMEQINKPHNNIHVADVGTFFTQHLRQDFGLTATPLRFLHSLSLTSPDYTRLSPQQVAAIFSELGVVNDHPIVAFAGRVDSVKGLDLLVEALRFVQRPFRLVAATSPNHRDDPNLTRITRQLSAVNYPYTLIPHFSRELFRALCCSGQVAAIVCPSRGEPIGAVPQEAALLAAETGPIVIASNRDGLAEQIIDGVSGILFDPDKPEELAQAITSALDMPPNRTALMRLAAEHKVRAERDFGTCLNELLTDLTERTTAPEGPREHAGSAS